MIKENEEKKKKQGRQLAVKGGRGKTRQHRILCSDNCSFGKCPISVKRQDSGCLFLKKSSLL